MDRIHLLYTRALDLRLQLILARAGYRVKPASSLAALFQSYRTGSNELVVIDVADDLDAGISLVEMLSARFERAMVVPVCAGASLDFFRHCFRAGALDVLDKSFDDRRIAEAIDATRASSRLLASPLSCARRRQTRFKLLTHREREVCRHLVEGLTSREIAGLLGVSARTVDAHRAHVQAKLCVRNVAQLAGEYRGMAGA